MREHINYFMRAHAEGEIAGRARLGSHYLLEEIAPQIGNRGEE